MIDPSPFPAWRALPAHREQRVGGFTLIELLVVILIIVVLAAMLLSGWQALKRALKRTETAGIMKIVQEGLSVRSAESGSAPTPAEHPLAGSKAPRLTFVGERDGAWTVLRRTDEALSATDQDRVAADERDRLITGEDLFAEADAPTFYGLRRRVMGVVGGPIAAFTRRLVLSRAAIPAHEDYPQPYLPFDPIRNDKHWHDYETADPPHYPDMIDGNPLYPRDICLVEGIDTVRQRVTGEDRSEAYYQRFARVLHRPIDNRQMVGWLFPANLQEELREIGGLREPDNDTSLLLSGPTTPAGWVGRAQSIEYKAIDNSRTDEIIQGYSRVPAIEDNPRLWSDDPGREIWEPGRIRVSNDDQLEGDGLWYSYLLRGPAIYDSWGREILYARNDAGGFYLVSAGEDGCFAIAPGLVAANGTSIFATDVSAGYDGVPDSPDRDASTDNVVQGR